MEMEMQVTEEASALLDRLSAAATVLEQAAERLAAVDLAAMNSAASFDRAHTREAELERLLAEAETTIASLRGGRKTQPAGVATLLAKDGSPADLHALDAALTSLSVEQRIAVKAQMLRSGLIG